MNKHNFPTAAYRTCGLPQYDGNPLIEALPPILSDADIGELLKREVPYENEQRFLPAEVRRHALDAISTFFVPLPQHLHLVHTVSKVIRTGYTSRNPVNPRFWANIPGQRTNLTTRINGVEQAPENTLGMAIVGPSGTGKTYSANRTLRLYPQVIEHTDYKGQQISLIQLIWLKLDCPFDGSIKGLATKFFAGIDRILDTEYHRIYGHGRRTVDQMMPDMASVAALHALGCLVIDEIQHLEAARHIGRTKMLNFFTEMSNTMNVPIILMGTPKAIGVLSSEFRSARRATGQGAIYWDRMKNNAIWKSFLKALWKYQFTAKETPLTDEMADLLYDQCQGITHLAVTLYSLAQDRVIGISETLTPEVLEKTAAIYFKPVQPFLNALRTGNQTFINMEDLNCEALATHIAELKEKTVMFQQQEASTAPLESMVKQSKPARPKGANPSSSGVLGSLERAIKEKRNAHEILKEDGHILDVSALLPT